MIWALNGTVEGLRFLGEGLRLIGLKWKAIEDEDNVLDFLNFCLTLEQFFSFSSCSARNLWMLWLRPNAPSTLPCNFYTSFQLFCRISSLENIKLQFQPSSSASNFLTAVLLSCNTSSNLECFSLASKNFFHSQRHSSSRKSFYQARKNSLHRIFPNPDLTPNFHLTSSIKAQENP
jgi:hypothetical protein